MMLIPGVLATRTYRISTALLITAGRFQGKVPEISLRNDGRQTEK
jgi:hypothetical protein